MDGKPCPLNFRIFQSVVDQRIEKIGSIIALITTEDQAYMKQLRLSLILLILLVMGQVGYAQKEGELDRFATSAIEKKNKVSLFPNPAVDYIQVKIENSNLTNAKMVLYNVIGNEVEVEVRKEEDDTYMIDVADLPAGYYFLAIRDEKNYFRETYKFVKR